MARGSHFDVIVLGVGSMGAAACYYLAKKGKRVLGLEQFEITHERGSHNGQSRIIRQAYFEHPDYVPLLKKAYHNWRVLEQDTGTTLYHRTGLFYAGMPDSPLIAGTKRSAARYHIPLDVSAATHEFRFPAFRVPGSFEILFEPDAGFVTPERAILTYAQQALQLGATLRARTPARLWKTTPSHIEIETDSETFTCDALVITAGAWASQLLPELSNRLTVTRQVAAWLEPHVWDKFALGNMPCWLIAPPEFPGAFYGFPILPVQQFGGPVGLKVAYHYPGVPVSPEHVHRDNMNHEEAHLTDAIERFLPGGYASTLALKTCLYTNTPDEHFIIDFVPGTDRRVVVAAGFSGHGFKFVAGLGETLADMAINKSTHDPINFLGLNRFSSSL